MTTAIHYIGAGLKQEYVHLHIPISRGELPADEVVLIHPSDEDPMTFHFREQLTNALEDEADVIIKSSELGRDEIFDAEYSEIYHFAYSELVDCLHEDNEVYINVASGPVFLSYAFMYATFNLLLESSKTTPSGEPKFEFGPSHVRDSIHFYETAGHSYLGDIYNSLNAFSTVLTTLETNSERQKELLNTLETIGERYENFLQILTILTESSESRPRWREFSTYVDDLQNKQSTIATKHDDSITDLNTGLQQFFEGMSKMSDGLDILSDEQLRTEIINSPELADFQHFNDIMSLLDHASELSSDDPSPVEGNALILLLKHQLGDIINIIDELDIRRHDIERLIEKNQLHARFQNEIWDNGISGGAIRIGKNQRHLELPIPPAAGLRDLESAVIVTLYSRGPADSITELIDNLIQMAIRVMIHVHDEPERSEHAAEFVELQEKLEDDESEISQTREELIKTLRSKVQYNLNQLEEKGFIQKDKKGRSNRIDLTHPGELWIYANEFDRKLAGLREDGSHENIVQIFDEFARDISEKI